MTRPATTVPVGPSSPAGTARRNRCYSCGGYSYNGKRHRDCPPKYRRARLNNCDRCGLLSVGLRHKACGDEPSRPCGYCGEPTRGRFHNRCAPVGLGRLALFGDDPYLVQRSCSGCGDWFPFASVDGSTAEASLYWNSHGRAPSGRPLFDGMCKACKAQRRRRVSSAVRADIHRLRQEGASQDLAARRAGVSRRTVIRLEQSA